MAATAAPEWPADPSEELLRSSFRGKTIQLRQLVEELKVDPNFSSENGCTALHAAASAGQLDVLKYLMSLPNINLEAVDSDHQSALQYAAFHGHLEVVQYLVQNGMPVDIPDKLGRLAHTAAAINGHLDVVKFLLEEAGDKLTLNINAIDEFGGTALHWAALKGRKEVVQYLVYKGIDVFCTSYDNKTAYQLANDRQRLRCAAILKQWLDRTQAFLSAAEDGNLARVEEIVNEVGNLYPIVYMRNKDGCNVLHVAARAGSLAVVKLVGKVISDIELCDTDKFGRTPLHYAALRGQKECAMWLVKRGRGTPLIHSLTLTEKSASRCAFEMGHHELAARLQALEEGHEELTESGKDDASVASAPHGDSRQHLADSVNLKPSDSSSDKRFSETSHNSGEDSKTEASDHIFRSGDSVNSVPTRSAAPISEVAHWLKMIKMEEYTGFFEQDGFDNLRSVATLNEQDLVDMNVKKGHRRLILNKIAELRSQLEALDRIAALEGREADADPRVTHLQPLAREETEPLGQLVPSSVLTHISSALLNHTVSHPIPGQNNTVAPSATGTTTPPPNAH